MATFTVQQSGGDYTTLAAALSDTGTKNGDIINIQGSWTIDDTSPAEVTDSLTIQCLGASKHPGYWDTSQNHYRLRTTTSAHSLTLTGANDLTLDGIAVEQAGTTTSAEAFRCVPNTGRTATIKNSLFWCSTNTSEQDCIYTGFNTTIGTIALENCIIWGANRGGINSQNASTADRGGAVTVNSCTFWNNGKATSGGGGGILWQTSTGGGSTTFTYDCHNVVAVENDSGGAASRDFNEHLASTGTGPLSWDVSYSIDSDNSIVNETDGGTGNLASRTATDNTSPGAGDWVVFKDITNSPFDFRLQSSSENDAQDMHAVATAHGITIPATDIVGTSRPQNTNYDCGAFELLPADSLPSLFSTIRDQRNTLVRM